MFQIYSYRVLYELISSATEISINCLYHLWMLPIQINMCCNDIQGLVTYSDVLNIFFTNVGRKNFKNVMDIMCCVFSSQIHHIYFVRH